MSFLWPGMLLFLIVIPLFALLYGRLQQRRRRLAESFGSLGLVANAARGLDKRRHMPPAFFMAGLAVLVFALARPQAVVNLPRVEGTVILAFDVSGSMAADDLKPTRMEAAKTAARKFVERQPSTVKIGVVAFSESGFSVQAPTNDPQPILAAIDRISPQRGTSLAQGILASLNVIEGKAGLLAEAGNGPQSTPSLLPDTGTEEKIDSAVIVLLTDGENTAPPDPLEAVQAAAERGVRIYPVGIGSPEGTTLTVNGFRVHTRLDEATLEQIAALTSGEYSHAGSEDELEKVYSNLNPQLVIKPEAMEITSILAGLGLFILLAGGAFSLLWFGRLP